ncbi:hypothetical protein FSP39_010456 [Pinctada imbricata]|uniref:Uncharacterized protein n=1 Tax=Pinctada imbricata TaxID=66713 RepID=A0AA88Y005_PINIB|nr:hypothetical protein FSP39_010456 [Pinctada imbricata]
MSIRSFELWDYVIFVLCMCVSAGIGVYHGFFHGGQKTTEEYYYGNRQMGALPLALSLLVTYQSSIFLLGYPGEMYVYGSMFWLSFIGVSLGFLLIAWFVVPLLHPLQIRSAFQYLEKRYDHVAPRKVASFLSVILYGGFKAVIWADVFQSIIIIIGLVALLSKGLISVNGGIQKVWDICEDNQRIEFNEFSGDITVRHTVWGMVIGKAVEFFSLGFTQLIVQRVSSARTVREAQKAVFIAIPGFIVYGSVACLLGLIVFAYNTQKGCDPLEQKIIRSPNQVLPYFVMDVFRELPGLPGVFLAALFSASLSTLSSGLNSLPTITWEDFMKPLFPEVSDMKATLIGKILVIVYGGIAIAVAYLVVLVGGPIVQVTSTISSCIGGPVCGMFVLGATFKMANYKGAMVGCLASFAFLLWIALGAVLQYRYPRLPGSVTDKCPGFSSMSLNVTGLNPNTTLSQSEMDFSARSTAPEILWVYRISYVWYTFIGIVLCVMIGLIVSVLTGGLRSSNEVKSQHLFWVRRLFDRENKSNEKRPSLYREADPQIFLPEMKEALNFKSGDPAKHDP